MKTGIGQMFTPDERQRIRISLIELAAKDQRLSGGAITGSASVDNQDEWSDIDLAFGVKASSDVPVVLNDFTQKMYSDFGALHHLDVMSGPWIYRVFFLTNTLQVDLAFVPEPHFGARAITFKLVFGTSNPISHDPPVAKDSLIGWSWLMALHVRSAIKRNKLWQAEYYVSGMRDYLISLYCLRHALPERQARGVDQLPIEIKKKLESSLVRTLDKQEMLRAFEVVVEMYLAELSFHAPEIRHRMEDAIRRLQV